MRRFVVRVLPYLASAGIMLVLLAPFTVRINVYGDGGYQMENSVLGVNLLEDGRAAVTDKRTGRTWTQYYLAPKENVTLYEADLSTAAADEPLIQLSEAELSNIDGRLVIRADMSKMQAGPKISTSTILPNLDVANVRVEIEYLLENINTCNMRGSISMFNYGWKGLKMKSFDLFDVDGNAPSGWQTATAPISMEEIPQATDSFSLQLSMYSPPGEGGSVHIRSIRIVADKNDKNFVTVSGIKKGTDEITFDINSFDRIVWQKPPLKGRMFFDPSDNGTLCFELSGLDKDAEFGSYLRYPGTFHSGEDDLYWMLPKDAGLLLPSTDLDNATNKAFADVQIGEFYSHMGYNMSFIGAVSDSAGDGYLMIVDTPISAKVRYGLSDINGKTAYMPQLFWFGSKELWVENRVVRFRFVEDGGVVGLAKTYRKIADEKGFLVTYEEKAKENPAVIDNAKSHRVDLALYVDEIVQFYEKMAELKIPNLMIKLSGARRRSDNYYAYIEAVQEAGILDEVTERFPQYQLYEYECYRDLFTEEGEFKVRPEYVAAIEPYKLKQKSGSFLRGWTDISGLQSYVVCPWATDAFLKYQNKTYPPDKYPYVYKQHDVLATVSLSEGDCYDENHPCDRYKTYDFRIKILKDMKEIYGIGTHIEGAAEYMVPYCEGFEGALDIMAHGGGGPLNTMNISMSDRIPLWELVYHDCGSLYFHWENGILTNENTGYQDLICSLYGEKGMFLPRYMENIFVLGFVEAMAERIKRIDTVLQKAATDEMVSFEFVSGDRLVQKTTFASGLSVIANFSDSEYTYNGKTIKSMDFITEGNSGGVSGFFKNIKPVHAFLIGCVSLAVLSVGGALIGSSISKKKKKKKKA